MAENPWNTDPIYLHVGSFNKISSLSKRFVLTDQSPDVSSVEHYLSVEFIHLLKELTTKNREQIRIDNEIEQGKICKEFYNVLNSDILDGLISMLDFLSLHLQRIIEEKEKLVECLHKPHTEGYLIVDEKYHRALCEIFPRIVKQLNEVDATMRNIEWLHGNSIKDKHVMSSLELVSSVFSTLQVCCQATVENRKAMTQLLDERANN